MIVRLLRVVSLCLPLIAAHSAFAAIYVGGDSLGVGVGMAGRAPSVAKESVMIRSPLPLRQIARVPAGSTLFLSLGTNDAVGNVIKVDANVAQIVAAAKSRNIRLVWIGPPCVFKSWDKSAVALDRHLADLLRRSGVTYVSMRDANICSRSVRARDGVHFNMTGYREMWDKALAAANGTAAAAETVAATDAAPAAAVAMAAPAAPVQPVAVSADAGPAVVTAAMAPAKTVVVPLPPSRPDPAMVVAVNTSGIRSPTISPLGQSLRLLPFKLTILKTHVVKD